MENWLGQVQIKVDEKGRCSLPSSASLFDGELVLSVSVFEKKPFLEMLTSTEWENKVARLEKFSDRDPKLKAYKRFLISGSSKVSIDKQNRITIPLFQRNMMKLSKEAVVVNLENKIELWSAELWDLVSTNFINDFENLEEWIDGFDESTIEKDEEAVHDIKSAA